MPSRFASASIALWVLCIAAPTAGAQQAPLEGLDGYIEEEMDEWRIPGLAIAVVKDDSIVYAEGFGVRELGQPEPVDPRTLFAIGSASKAFTAASLGMLVDAERITWNDPATRHLPEFQLYGPYTTRELTVRDLLTHRSGLSRGDMLWYGTTYDRDEILRRVRYLEPTWSFRSHFGYQNIMFLAAGQIVPSITNESWDEFVDERIFTPLGMSASSTSTLALEGVENVATPHAEIDDEMRPIEYRNIDNIGPAGSINSNVLEMAQWVRLHLNEGVYGGDTILRAETVREMHSPQTIIEKEGGWALMAPASDFLTYGMGWFLNDYRGHKVVQHGGNIDGMHALVGMLPEEELGLVVLTNMGSNHLTYALMYRVFDAYLGETDTDWSRVLLARVDSLREIGEGRQQEFEESRVAGTSPSLPLEGYAGTYTNQMYGDAEVVIQDGRLVLRRGPTFVGDLEHWHYNTFEAEWRDPALGESYVTFTLGPMGKAREMALRNFATFERVPDMEEARAGAN